MKDYGLKAGTILNHRYEIKLQIGSGGMGYTYSAYDKYTGTEVAVKEMFPHTCCYRADNGIDVAVYSRNAKMQYEDCRNSFKQEVKCMSIFTGCPELLSTLDDFEENGTCYYIMELLHGMTMKERLIQCQIPIAETEIKTIAIKTLNALSYLHKKGIIHRDIACDNIFLTNAGNIRILDYGSAAKAGRTENLSIILKPGYAPPEQYRAEGELGPWTDIYALGAVMYRAVTGKMVIDALTRIQKDDLVPPIYLNGLISSELNHVIMKALALDPKKRFQTAEEFRSWLENGGLKEEPAGERGLKKYICLAIGILFVIGGCIAGLIFLN